MSGAVADVVGRMIRDVSGHRQVLCITHLPQVAAHADAHLLVEEALRGRAHRLRGGGRWRPDRSGPGSWRGCSPGSEVTREALGAAEALVRAAQHRRVRPPRAGRSAGPWPPGRVAPRGAAPLSAVRFRRRGTAGSLPPPGHSLSHPAPCPAPRASPPAHDEGRLGRPHRCRPQAQPQRGQLPHRRRAAALRRRRRHGWPRRRRYRLPHRGRDHRQGAAPGAGRSGTIPSSPPPPCRTRRCPRPCAARWSRPVAAIYTAAQEDPRLAGMGTTVISLVVKDDNAFFAHVGDSRAYLVRGDLIQQISEDHSLVNEQIKAGMITPEEAKHSRYKNIITRSVGFEEEVQVDVMGLVARAGRHLRPLLGRAGQHGRGPGAARGGPPVAARRTCPSASSTWPTSAAATTTSPSSWCRRRTWRPTRPGAGRAGIVPRGAHVGRWDVMCHCLTPCQKSGGSCPQRILACFEMPVGDGMGGRRGRGEMLGARATT